MARHRWWLGPNVFDENVGNCVRRLASSFDRIQIPTVFEKGGNKPGHHRRAAYPMVPRDRSSRLVETRRNPIVVVGSVYIVLDVLLAAPDHLDGTVDLLGNFDREKGTIWLKPTAEASTQILIVDHNGLLRHSSERRDRRLRDGGQLRADPDFAYVLPIWHRAI